MYKLKYKQSFLIYTYLIQFVIALMTAGTFSSEERHGSRVCNEDTQEGGHAGERAGELNPD